MTLIHLPGNRGSQRGGLQVILDSSSGAHGSGSRITTAEISHWRKLSPGPSKCVAPHAAVNIPAHTSLGAVGAVPRSSQSEKGWRTGLEKGHSLTDHIEILPDLSPSCPCKARRTCHQSRE
uniref:Uncharacterized protein n=1 Tax=Molossus molossus TaxID=27622 RepID=A0A7J8JWB9_MOLMO|nr:hypothetical protein HJG59_008117 [Molossus molossus]